MFQSKGMALSTETWCKQISPIQKKKKKKKKKTPTLSCDTWHLSLSLSSLHVINQIKITSWSFAHLMWNILNNHASSIHVKSSTLFAACIKDITIFTPMQDEVFFPLKFGVQICEVILNSHMKHWTWSFWTGPCGVKPRPALPNHHVRAALFLRYYAAGQW